VKTVKGWSSFSRRLPEHAKAMSAVAAAGTCGLRSVYEAEQERLRLWRRHDPAPSWTAARNYGFRRNTVPEFATPPITVVPYNAPPGPGTKPTIGFAPFAPEKV
jgi:hypothetical protein